jgi:hypothetical protein
VARQDEREIEHEGAPFLPVCAEMRSKELRAVPSVAVASGGRPAGRNGDVVGLHSVRL